MPVLGEWLPRMAAASPAERSPRRPQSQLVQPGRTQQEDWIAPFPASNPEAGLRVGAGQATALGNAAGSAAR